MTLVSRRFSKRRGGCRKKETAASLVFALPFISAGSEGGDDGGDGGVFWLTPEKLSQRQEREGR